MQQVSLFKLLKVEKGSLNTNRLIPKDLSEYICLFSNGLGDSHQYLGQRFDSAQLHKWGCTGFDGVSGE